MIKHELERPLPELSIEESMDGGLGLNDFWRSSISFQPETDTLYTPFHHLGIIHHCAVIHRCFHVSYDSLPA